MQRRESFFIDQQRLLREKLDAANLPAAVIDRAMASGYFAWGIRDFGPGDGRPAVMDSYYGNKWSGLMEMDEFVSYLRDGTVRRLPSGVSTHTVRNLAEALTILGEPRQARFAGRMCFRGQTTDYYIRRSLPNPRAAGADGQERMIVPSWWRPRINKNPAERLIDSDRRLFSSPALVAPLLYHDIAGWRDHIAPIDSTCMTDGQICETCTLMEARREEHMSSLARINEAPLLEQHYGMPTIGLDVTFDPATAFFFASHRFVQEGAGARFEPVASGERQGIVYCFVFESPPVRETEFLVRDISLFRHVSPLRPIRQRCGLPAFHFNEVAAAARDLHAVFHLHDAFDLSDLPAAATLFPNRKEDRFYDALLELRERSPEIWGSVVEYEPL